MRWLLDIMKQFNIWVLNTSLRLRKILNLAHFIITTFPKVSSALVNTGLISSKTGFQRHL